MKKQNGVENELVNKYLELKHRILTGFNLISKINESTTKILEHVANDIKTLTTGVLINSIAIIILALAIIYLIVRH